jgi:hypothetical protein
MNTTYHTLNKKLDTLQTRQQKQTTSDTPTHAHTHHNHILNLSSIHFTKEQMNTISLGLNFAIEQAPHSFLNTLIIEMENAIQHLDPTLQSTFCHLATKKVKQIASSNRYNIEHKHHQYHIKQIRKNLEQYEPSIVKADKGSAIVIIPTSLLHQKIHTFLQKNHMQQLPKDPTDMSQKQLQQAIQYCPLIL